MPEDLFNDLIVLNKTNDPHLSLAFRASQGSSLINFLNYAGPVFWVLFGGASRLRDRRDQSILGFSFRSPREILLYNGSFSPCLPSFSGANTLLEFYEAQDNNILPLYLQQPTAI